MTIDMSQFHQVFFDEAEEHLATMESLLLTLDTEQPDLDDLNAIFRAAHSIKGGSGTFGFTDMTEVTHILETLLDLLRKSELQPTLEMVDAFLRSVDVLKAQLQSHRSGGEAVDESEVREVCATLSHLSRGDGAAANPPSDSKAAPIQSGAQKFRIVVNLPRGPDMDTLIDDLANVGRLSEQDTQQNHFEFSLETGLSDSELRDIFAFFLQPQNYELTVTGAAASASGEAYGFFEKATDTATTSAGGTEAYGFFDEVPTPAAVSDDSFGFFDDAPGVPAVPASVEKAEAGAAKPYGFFVPESEIESRRDNARGYGFFQEPVAPADAAKSAMQIEKPKAPSGKKAEPKAAAAAASGDNTSIRVSVEKVDQLINLVGELVITQAMLAQTASEVDPVLQENLLNGIALLQRNTRDLQEAVMSIRMLPMNFVFSRFPRLVRDLAGKMGKDINFKTEGEGTELDKGLIEKITDPLTHLVRNSLDHGIELPDVRVAKGKSPRGNLVLRAFHQGGNVIIEVQDDGAGLNRDRILAKARERGLGVTDTMPDAEVWQLIFAPGFSTAEQVTDVSGRGVGMDVVKKNIESLGGRVEIDSVQNVGTKITIRLPLTLAILDGLSISVGDEVFIVPLTSIVESLQPAPEDVKTVAGQGRVVHVRGEYLPLVALYDLFGIEPVHCEPHMGTLMIVEGDGIKGAMLVDELMGQHQVVIKSLESNYRKVPGVSGATIMGDGRVALILDVTAVMRLGRNQIPRQPPKRKKQAERKAGADVPAVATASDPKALGAAGRKASEEPPVSDTDTVQLENAVAAHSKWKMRLRQFLDGGEEKLDPKVVCRDNACDLGKWIYGDGSQFKDMPAYRELKTSHAHFHKCAADVVTKHLGGDKRGAESMIAVGGDFVKASSETVQAIIKLQKTLESRAVSLGAHSI
jgi:two-component system chemotaxis sensor kinase CheA